MSWLEDLIQSFEKAEQDEGRPEPGGNDIAEGPSDGLDAGYNFDADRTPFSPSDDTPAVGTMPGEVWPGDDYGGGGEAPGAGWNAMRREYQAAGLGAGGRPASEPVHAWLDGVRWEDLTLLRQLAQAHSAEEPGGSRGLSGKLGASPEARLEGVTWDDLFFVKVIAEARRAMEQKGSRDLGEPSPQFSPRPASFGAAEPTPSLDLRSRLKAYRALHPTELTERGESGAISALGGLNPAQALAAAQERINPSLQEWEQLWQTRGGEPGAHGKRTSFGPLAYESMRDLGAQRSLAPSASFASARSIGRKNSRRRTGPDRKTKTAVTTMPPSFTRATFSVPCRRNG